jgi:purine-nucleoside phosphorylase
MTINRSIVRPGKGKNSPKLGDCAVMAASEADLRMVCGRMNLHEADFIKLFMSRLYAADQRQTDTFTLVGPFIGAPYAAMILETLIAWGARKILFLGWCGGVSSDVKIGDIIIPDCAFIDEGTSISYKNNKSLCVLPSDGLTENIKKSFSNDGICFKTGSVWTTDAVYRETSEKVKYYRNKDVLAVDMELSAVFTVANFYRVEVAGVLVVSDEISTGKRVTGFSSKYFKKSRAAVCNTISSICLEKKI